MSGSKTSKGPVYNPGQCRCCGNMKKCRVLNVEYESLGQKEVYSDMIMDCFNLVLSHLDSKPTERLVCATCVTRLRDAHAFRRQVLKCEEAFLHMKIYDSHLNEPDTTMVDTLDDRSTKIKIEIVKLEPMDEGNDYPSHYDDAAADAPDNDVKSDNMDDSADDLPLQRHVDKIKASSAPQKPTPHSDKKPHSDKNILTRSDMLTRTASPARSATMSVRSLTRRSDNLTKRSDKDPRSGIRGPPKVLASQIMLKQKVNMSRLQQLMRERDPTYMTETNILTIVEYSYVCPFKCRHNHLLCYYCGGLYSSPEILREHTVSTHHPKKFKVTDKNMIKIDLTRIDCRLCPIKIDNLDDFKKHISSVHKKQYYFDHKDSVLPFILTKDEMKCAICGQVFPYFHALNKHMNEHFSNYVCETCGLGFVDKGRFVMHQQRHEDGVFPCETCGKVFKAQYNKDLHVDRVHHKRGRVYCPKCDVKLMSYPQKLKHLVEVHGEEPLSFPCMNCERIFDTRRNLTIHRRKEHLKDYRYECQCCGQKFFTRFALNNHMPTHTGERNYKCKVCEKTYPRLKTLKDHMRIHTNDRRYRCHVCAQAFIQNCSLKGHMKSQHPEYVYNTS